MAPGPAPPRRAMCHRRAARGLRALTVREGPRLGGTEGGTDSGRSARGPGREKVPGGAPSAGRVGVSAVGAVSWESLGRSSRRSRGLLRLDEGRQRPR